MTLADADRDRFGFVPQPILFSPTTGWIVQGTIRAEMIWAAGSPIYAQGLDGRAYRLDPDGRVAQGPSWSATVESVADLAYERTEQRWYGGFAREGLDAEGEVIEPAVAPAVCPICGYALPRPAWMHSRLCPAWRPR